ncbi:MAG: hypothetical protein IT260_18800 [Saprospiraceae bacterium]|nr:hypothetical protein [Saprospiraceae bacterium]
MTPVTCPHCNTSGLATNDTVLVDGTLYCSSCIDMIFRDPSLLEGRQVEKVLDPTVCANCGKDNGDIAFGKISTYPICPDCALAIRQRTLPLWVKGFFAFILLVVVFACYWNWRFYQGYQHLQDSNTAFQTGQYRQAEQLAFRASQDVPEIEDLLALHQYYLGVALLTEDKSAEALKAFDLCKEKMPADFNVGYLIDQAKVGASFDSKDYGGFLTISKKVLREDSIPAISWARVASAYACLYAEKGQDSLRTRALDYLQSAQRIDSTSQDMTEYYNMIQHRLFTKNILTRDEFRQQFPKGWTKE